MKQLVQLQKQLSDEIAQYNVNVLVIFREEDKGQEGLLKVVEQTQTQFTLALDWGARQTQSYSPGQKVHDSYLIGNDGVILAILPGKRYDRAQATEFAQALLETVASRR